MKEILERSSLEGLLTEEEESRIARLSEVYQEYTEAEDKDSLKRRMDAITEDLLAKETRIRIHPSSPQTSRILSKVRCERTGKTEFTYFTQRAYELLFRFAFLDGIEERKARIVKTPVGTALHYFPDADDLLHNTVLCVMLRGALLPSMVIGKAIEDYTSDSFVPPYALFSVKREESGDESTLRYVLDMERSYFNLSQLDGKDLVFADPMNATGGSFITIMGFMRKNGARPRSVKFLNLISSVPGPLRTVRACPEAEVYTLSADPAMNERAYILPGLGDAGDRLNGIDIKGQERNLMMLIADYGPDILALYRNQVREIEKTVLC